MCGKKIYPGTQAYLSPRPQYSLCLAAAFHWDDCGPAILLPRQQQKSGWQAQYRYSVTPYIAHGHHWVSRGNPAYIAYKKQYATQ